MDREGRVAGKKALVTGGAGGIGRGLCEALAREGAEVAVADISLAHAEAVAEAIGPSAFAVLMDAGDPASIAAAVQQTVDRFGRIDILVNSAAVTDPKTMSEDSNAKDIDLDLYDRVMDVNARGYLAGCKYVLPHMLAQGGGTIVNIASGAGQLGHQIWLAYGMSKAAVIQLTRSVATAFGKQGIRCNAIAPYVILTENSRVQAPQDMLAVYERYALTPRLGEVADMAAMVLYLASDESGFVTGQTLNCDGGISAQHAMVPDVMDWMRANS
jgi:NAD(P)-dependent dehydrogenase (short-subunit alcohol dehydrogenase family)